MRAPTGGTSGIFKRFWYSFKLILIGLKWNFIELFTFHKKFDLQKVPRRPGEVALITGGARGIGLEVIKKLLILDMHVIIGCRNEAAGNEMIESFRKKGINTGTTDILSLDLMSLDSVKEFATKVLAKYTKIHVLLNNAGIMAAPYKLTKDGFESQMQVNYLSHFLLTNMLLPRIIRAGRAGKASRIVNVSSCAHYGGFINFEDINMQQMYSADMAYMASKLMQVVNARDLNARLAKEGANVNVYAVHPGVILTELYEHIFLAKLFSFFLKLIYKTPEQGADGVTFAAISSKFEGEGGLFFANCKKNSVNSLAKDPELQKRLWEVSCHLTGWENVPIGVMMNPNWVPKVPKQANSHATTNKANNSNGIPKDTSTVAAATPITTGRETSESKNSKADETFKAPEISSNVTDLQDPFPQEMAQQDIGINSSGFANTRNSDIPYMTSRPQTKEDLEVDPSDPRLSIDSRLSSSSQSSVMTVISNVQQDKDSHRIDITNNDNEEKNDIPTIAVTVVESNMEIKQSTAFTIEQDMITDLKAQAKEEGLLHQDIPRLETQDTEDVDTLIDSYFGNEYDEQDDDYEYVKNSDPDSSESMSGEESMSVDNKSIEINSPVEDVPVSTLYQRVMVDSAASTENNS